MTGSYRVLTKVPIIAARSGNQALVMNSSTKSSLPLATVAPQSTDSNTLNSVPLWLQPYHITLPALVSDANTSSTSTDVTNPASDPTLASTQCQTRRYGFGQAAHSQDLPFSAHTKMAAADLFAFLLHSIKVAGIIFRLVSSGGTRRLFTVMVNM